MCGNLEKYESKNEVATVLRRLGQHSINMRNFCITIQHEKDTWNVNPVGFKFFSGNVQEFIRVLGFSPGFGTAMAYYDLKKGHKVFREVARKDSLHIILSEAPKGQCIIHLDSISIASARDMITGNVIYNEDLGVLIKHLRVDKQHK